MLKSFMTVMGHDTDNDGVSDEFEIVGCRDELACNYDPSATGHVIMLKSFMTVMGIA